MGYSGGGPNRVAGEQHALWVTPGWPRPRPRPRPRLRHRTGLWGRNRERTMERTVERTRERIGGKD